MNFTDTGIKLVMSAFSALRVLSLLPHGDSDVITLRQDVTQVTDT